MSEYAPQVPMVITGEVRNGAASFANLLGSTELLTSTSDLTVVEIGTTDLTISNVGLSTATATINGVSVTANKYIKFKVIGFAANKTYKLRLQGVTDSTPAQTLRGKAKFVVAPST